jgi:hypothetical protein
MRIVNSASTQRRTIFGTPVLAKCVRTASKTTFKPDNSEITDCPVIVWIFTGYLQQVWNASTLQFPKARPVRMSRYSDTSRAA